MIEKCGCGFRKRGKDHDNGKHHMGQHKYSKSIHEQDTLTHRKTGKITFVGCHK